jgi:hypothetical protein
MAIRRPKAGDAEISARLVAELEAARKDAIAWDYDQPSPAALRRAEDLLTRLAQTVDWRETIDCAVAVDGSIEVTGTRHSQLIVLDLDASGSHLQLVLQDLESGQIVMATSPATASDAVRQLERAV